MWAFCDRVSDRVHLKMSHSTEFFRIITNVCVSVGDENR